LRRTTHKPSGGGLFEVLSASVPYDEGDAVKPRSRLPSATRARVMRSIRSTNTRPELIVRRLLRSLGMRYRLHARELPGRPDIVNRRARVAILVHGCFWHQHDGCALARVPRSRPDYWPEKLARNRERDQINIGKLSGEGWRVLVVWECETIGHLNALTARLKSFVSHRERS
jgi:DNA mismatch endonuclease, patch repair protein